VDASANRALTRFESGFICAKTVYATLCGEAGAKEAGKLRQKGEEYVVQDGNGWLLKLNV
jgi:hypothetical protein